jgi:hypothetical protein
VRLGDPVAQLARLVAAAPVHPQAADELALVRREQAVVPVLVEVEARAEVAQHLGLGLD